MPERTTIERAKRDLRAGKRPSTAAGEFVREEMEHIRRGQHGARNSRQAIAIGLSKARRAGVPLQAPAPGEAKSKTRKSAERDYEVGQGKRQPVSDSRKRRSLSHTRSKASSRALKRESRSAASSRALSAHAKETSSRRTRRSRAHAAR
jgi:hypothetical protein